MLRTIRDGTIDGPSSIEPSAVNRRGVPTPIGGAKPSIYQTIEGSILDAYLHRWLREATHMLRELNKRP
jgi:hypothetical protein